MLHPNKKTNHSFHGDQPSPGAFGWIFRVEDFLLGVWTSLCTFLGAISHGLGGWGWEKISKVSGFLAGDGVGDGWRNLFSGFSE